MGKEKLSAAVLEIPGQQGQQLADCGPAEEGARRQPSQGLPAALLPEAPDQGAEILLHAGGRGLKRPRGVRIEPLEQLVEIGVIRKNQGRA